MTIVAEQWGLKQRLVLVAGLAALGACVPYRPAPIDSGASAAQFAARRLDDPTLLAAVRRRLPDAVSSPGEWNRAALLVAALERNADLAVARAELATVQARETTAAQRPNPDLWLESEYAIHDAHPWLYGFYFDWLARSGARRRLEIDYARLDSRRARAELLDATWAVRHALTEALCALEGTSRRTQLLERLARAEDALVVAERRRITAGEDPPAELVAAERARIEVDQRASEERERAAAARAALARALGVPSKALEGVRVVWGDWGEPPALADAELAVRREQALLSRTDLLAALGAYSMSETRLHLAVARQYPELVLEPGYYWDHGIAKFPFDVGFTVPFNGNRGEIAEARAQRDLAAQRMLALQALIYGDIAAAQSTESIARENAAVAARQLEVARRQAGQVELAVRLGAADILERIAADIVALEAELALVDLRAELQSARDALEDALRSPLSGPELGLAPASETS